MKIGSTTTRVLQTDATAGGAAGAAKTTVAKGTAVAAAIGTRAAAHGNAAIDSFSRAEAKAPAAALTQLPDLDDAGGSVQADNLRAAGALVAAAQLEDLKVFQVADRLAEQFASGQLPIGRGERRGSDAPTLVVTTSSPHRRDDDD